MTDKIKHIPERKLKAFCFGVMSKQILSKKELEEQRKKEEERAAAHVFQEFVDTFQETPVNDSKVWVKAGTYDAGTRKDDTKDRGKLYKPQSRVTTSQGTAERAQATTRMLADDKKPEKLGKKKLSGKSNLESFKEELRRIQEQREEKLKCKGSLTTPIESELDLCLRTNDLDPFDNSDPTTTNLYVGNLNPKITEQQLMEVFGRYGPLASIKIMWPRSDGEKARGRNNGFVAYMSRKDSERALRNLNGKDILGNEMKLGWGKSVVIPPHPIYIPSALLELSLPPPASGLPFNAQPNPKDQDILPTTTEELNEILNRAVVKVVIPTDRNQLMVIHRMVEFVVREGPMFEAMIMNREVSNPLFRFLFENRNPMHIYYRWKLYSIMHGDSQYEWTMKEFRMFKGGSTWKPPLRNSYTSGMPDELVEDETKESIKGSLSNTQRDRLEDLIRNLPPESKKIGKVMVFCIQHSDAADEIADCILKALSNESTFITKKIARLYLISDILHNCGVKVNKASFYRRAFETRLIEIMKQLRLTHDKLEGRLQAEGFKIRILRTLKTWEDSIYPKDFMNKMYNNFLGLEVEENRNENVDIVQNWDGSPLQNQMDTDEDIPMDGAALLKHALKQKLKSPSPAVDTVDSDIDGYEIQEDDGKQNVPSQLSGFILSKWETIDPKQIEAQAMTTSKWDLLESSYDNSQDSKNENQDSSDCTDSKDVTEEKRAKLREIELKAMQYQDELESGQQTLKSGWSVSQQVEHYRRKLLKKFNKEKKEKKKNSGNSKPEKRKRDWEKMDGNSSEDESYYKAITSGKFKKHARNSRSSSSSKHRSKSHSPSPRKKSVQTPSPPSPPRIKKHSPTRSRSHHRNSSSGKYTSPAHSKYSEYSPSPSRPSRYTRKSPSSPNRYRESPSPPRSQYRNISPDVPRKHKHKHRH